MSLEVCKCTVGFSNTGDPSCQPIAKVTRGVFLMATVADDGTKNTLDVATPITDVVIDAKINEPDKSKRWFPLQELDNVLDERADDLVESMNSGVDIFIQEGSRTFESILIEKAPALHKELQSFRCGQISVFTIDKDGNLIGTQKNTDITILTPIKIQKGTLKPSFIKGNDATIQKVGIKWAYDDSENDGDLYMVSAEDTTVDFLSKTGLLDVNSTNGVLTTTEYPVSLFTDYGTAVDRILVEGLVSGDFAVQNLTDDSVVTVLTAPESPAGTYTLTFVAQASADVLEISSIKEGLDFSRVKANTAIVP